MNTSDVLTSPASNGIKMKSFKFHIIVVDMEKDNYYLIELFIILLREMIIHIFYRIVRSILTLPNSPVQRARASRYLAP